MGVFHFLRHGEHGLLGKVLAGRMPGVGMTERGRAEIASQAERLAREKIAAIYASPLQRTRESAEIVSARLGLPIEFRDDLLELDFGEWTGATFDSIRAVLRFALGMPLDFYNRIEIGQGSISTIQMQPSGIRVTTLGERPRLP